MSHSKIEAIKENIDKTNGLSESEKSESFKRIEEWVIEDKAFGILKEELLKVSLFFEEMFSEMGLK